MWPFDDPLNLSPFYNLILGTILIFAGIIGFKYIPGKTGTLVSLVMLGVGIAIALGYWVIF